MAQTKSQASTKRSGGSGKPQARSRKPTKARTGARKSQRKAGASNSKSAASSAAQKRGSSNGMAPRVSSAGRAVEGTAKDAGRAVGRAASKAKVPLVAGGAAIAGAAGGLALGTRQTRRPRGIGKVLPRRPQVKVKSRDVARAAKEVGNFSAQMGQLASELQHAREGANGKHRSPIEVVLQGLTSRRSP